MSTHKRPQYSLSHVFLAVLAVFSSVLMLFTASTSTIEAAPPPLTIQKTVDRDKALGGDTLTYTVTVLSNVNSAKKASVKDTLPGDATFVSASDGGKLSRDGATVSWSDLKIPALGKKSVTLVVAIKDGTVVGTVITNTAKLSGGGSATATTTVGPVTGDLYVTKSITPLRNRQVLGGTVGDQILRLIFHAENEPIDVTNLQLTFTGSSAVSVDRLELYKEGSAVAFANATVGGCGSDIAPPHTFCSNTDTQQLVVPKGEDVVVIVRPRLKTDVNGAVSGEKLQVYVSGKPVSNNATGEGAVRARGTTSANNLLANDGDTAGEGEVFIGTAAPGLNSDINGRANVSVLSKITSITNANPDANGTNVPVGIYDVGQFKIAAAANANSKNGLNKVVFSKVLFDVNATNVAVAANYLKLYNKANATLTASCAALTTGGNPIVGTATDAFLVSCTGLDTSFVNTEIDQGTDATFVLQLNVTNPKISPLLTSNLQVSLSNFDSITRTTFGPDASHVLWLDRDNGGSTSFFWIEYPETVVKSSLYQS